MNYRDFGRTGIKVSEIGFGGWAIGGNRQGISYGVTDDKLSLEALERALALGCNFFDTADVYGWGHSEALIGQALKGRRDHAVIATKVGSDFYQGYGYQTFSDSYIRFALEKSLERLQTDYLDVYQLHNPPLALLEDGVAVATLESLKLEGKVRAWGLSLRDAEEALAALSTYRPDSIQLPYNLFLGDHISPERSRLFTKAAEAGCAIIAREPLANGFLSGKYRMDPAFGAGDIRRSWPRDYLNARVQAVEQLRFLDLGSGVRTLAQASLAWVLRAREVSVVIPGIKTPEQAEEDLTAASAAALKPADLAQIAELQKRKFGLT